MFPCLLPGGGPLAPHVYTNVVIATFVTAQARLKLYSYLEFLGGSYFESLLVVGPRTMPLKSAMVW